MSGDEKGGEKGGDSERSEKGSVPEWDFGGDRDQTGEKGGDQGGEKGSVPERDSRGDRDQNGEKGGDQGGEDARPGGGKSFKLGGVAKETITNPDVVGMFQSVLGTGSAGATLSITHPKYKNTLNHALRFIKTLGHLHEWSGLASFYPDLRMHIKQYAEALCRSVAESFTAPDLEVYLKRADEEAKKRRSFITDADAYATIPLEAVAQFNAALTVVKTCNVVNIVIVTCNNLIIYKKHLTDPDKLNGQFLRRLRSSTLAPLPDLPQLNFKQLYIDDRLSDAHRTFVLIILHKLYTIGHDLYDAITAPDIKISDFIETVTTSLNEVRKKIPRCDQAFDKILESVNMLETNFDGYYKDYVESNNPTILMENFVVDVAKNTQSSTAVSAQFRTIIQHFRKLSAQGGGDSRLAAIVNQADRNMGVLKLKEVEDGADESLLEPAEDHADTEAPRGSPRTESGGPASFAGGAPRFAGGAKDSNGNAPPFRRARQTLSGVASGGGAVRAPQLTPSLAPSPAAPLATPTKSAKKRARQQRRAGRPEPSGVPVLEAAEDDSLAAEFGHGPPPTAAGPSEAGL